jgi:murein L,D-transpeptidase YafK
MFLLTSLLFISAAFLASQTLAGGKDSNDRVAAARKSKQPKIKKLFDSARISYPPLQIFIRVFKQEHDMELWVQSAANETFQLLKTYKICVISGGLGPKRRQGDLQAPEGFYHVTHFNPNSKFHLSMGINYPNASDQALGDQQHLGGDIFIHGNCASAGCMPIGDEGIDELYIIALDTFLLNDPIPVHIFPLRMTDANWPTLEALAKKSNRGLLAFWENIRDGYRYFEERKRPPAATIDAAGIYHFK